MNKMFIKKADIYKYVNCDDFYFFTRSSNKTYAITKKGSFVIGASLNYLNEIMGSDFLRTHKSYLVNISKIDSISKYTDRTYNIKFIGIRDQAYITNENMKILLSKGAVL